MEIEGKRSKLLVSEEAMILAAGRGNRMRYFTKYIAKPLIKIENKSLLELNLIKLSSTGIKKCIINTSYKHLSVKKFIKTYNFRKKYPKIIVSNETNRLETGGGVKNALQKFTREKVLVINGDSLIINSSCTCPIKNLYNYFSDYMDILLLLVPKKNAIGYSGNGDFLRSSNCEVFNIKRKKILDKSGLVFTGWQIIKKDILNSISKDIFSLNLAYNLAEKEKKLYGIVYDGTFLHIGNPKSYLLARNHLKKNNLKLS
ncbi:MAG: hypothetical protein CMP24_02290 [Rickettsiales bacterium]|nr:hypothetical protein [Rickettsiales bacterium]